MLTIQISLVAIAILLIVNIFLTLKTGEKEQSNFKLPHF